MAKKTLKNMENEKHTLSNLDYRVKQLKRFKMRNAHSLTWNISKKTKYKTLKNVENEKCTL
jgi:hypothetical protein